MAQKDEYFCGFCGCYRMNSKCEKCNNPTVTRINTAPGKKETSEELQKRWDKQYGGK